MDVIEKYGNSGNLDYILKVKIAEALKHTSDDDINNYIDKLCNKIQEIGVGGKIDNTLDYNYSFDCYGELREFLVSGANTIVNYAMNIHLKQIALFHLMNVGVLMPVNLTTYNKIELNINHSHGNTLFNLFMDILPYNCFLIIKLPT